MTITRKRLSEHILDALWESAARVLTDHPDLTDMVKDRIASILEGRDTRKLYARLDADTRRGTRPDTRSLRVTVWIVDERQPDVDPQLLVSVRVRDLVDRDGQPIDARTSAKELLWQHGHGIPDDPGGLDR